MLDDCDSEGLSDFELNEETYLEYCMSNGDFKVRETFEVLQWLLDSNRKLQADLNRADDRVEITNEINEKQWAAIAQLKKELHEQRDKVFDVKFK